MQSPSMATQFDTTPIVMITPNSSNVVTCAPRVSSYAALFNPYKGSVLKFILATIINRNKVAKIEKYDIELETT